MLNSPLHQTIFLWAAHVFPSHGPQSRRGQVAAIRGKKPTAPSPPASPSSPSFQINEGVFSESFLALSSPRPHRFFIKALYFAPSRLRGKIENPKRFHTSRITRSLRRS